MGSKRHDGNITTYRSAYLDCRVGMSGHNWRWLTDFKILRGPGGQIIEFSRARRCVRCRSESIKVYDGKTGTVLRRAYKYADGYMIAREHVGSFQPGGASLEALRRALQGGTAEEVQQKDQDPHSEE